jgi:hypothetical protein
MGYRQWVPFLQRWRGVQIMTVTKIKAAIKEAEEFIKRGKAVIKENKDDWICGTQATGALRRSSMELTRALAEMRKPI